MATPIQQLCDDGYIGTIEALRQWAIHNDGYVKLHALDTIRKQSIKCTSVCLGCACGCTMLEDI